jgi:hypothetical protein
MRMLRIRRNFHIVPPPGNRNWDAGVNSGMHVRYFAIHCIAWRVLLSVVVLGITACAPRRAPAPVSWRFDVSSQPDRLLPPLAVQPVKHVYRVPLDGLRFGHSGCRLSSGGFILRSAHDKLELRFGAYELNGAVTLEPGFRLKVVAPLLKAGYSEIKTALAPNAKPGQLEVNVEGLEGFETAYYDVRARPGGGVEFALTSVEQNRIGQIAKPATPTAFQFDIAPATRHFRLLFLRRLSIADRDISLLGGASWGVLLSSAQRFDTVPGSVSECTTTPGLECVAVTAKTAILSEVGVTINGRSAFVPIGGNLAELLNNFGFETQEQQDAALARLKVERAWHGEYYPIALDVKNSSTFGLVLFPGDDVSW